MITVWNYIVDSAIIIGSLSTAGAFIITASHNKKQDELLASLKMKEIDSKYRPGLLLNQYGVERGRFQIVIENRGEPLKLLSISSPNNDLLDYLSIEKWVKSGYVMESVEPTVIPLKDGITDYAEGDLIVLKVEDPIQRIFEISISKKEGFLALSKPKRVNDLEK